MLLFAYNFFSCAICTLALYLEGVSKVSACIFAAAKSSVDSFESFPNTWLSHENYTILSGYFVGFAHEAAKCFDGSMMKTDEESSLIFTIFNKIFSVLMSGVEKGK